MPERYKGVKFTTELQQNEIPAIPELDELRHWCKIFHDKELAPPYPWGSYGNLSFRLKKESNEFVITGSCIGLKDDIKNDCFVKVKRLRF